MRFSVVPKVFGSLVLVLCMAFVNGLFWAAPVFAQCPQGYQQVSIAVPGLSQQYPNPSGSGSINCVPPSTGVPNPSNPASNNPIVFFLKTVIQFLAVGIGIAVTGGIITGGIMYLTARGNSQQVQKAEETIRNAIIGLLLFIFTFTIINFLIPGGLLI